MNWSRLEDADFNAINSYLEGYRHKAVCWIVKRILECLRNHSCIIDYSAHRSSGFYYFVFRSDNYQESDIKNIVLVLEDMGLIDRITGQWPRIMVKPVRLKNV